MPSIPSYFSPRLLHAVHSVEMIVAWLLVFQSKRNFNFLPIFLIKYGLFLINNFFLPISIPLSTEIYSDFLLLLIGLFWFRPHRLLSTLKSDSVESYSTLFFRVIFYSIFSIFRSWSICLAVERYETDSVSLGLSCLILLEFSSLVFLFKTREFTKFFNSFVLSVILSTVVTLLPQYAQFITLAYFVYRHVVCLVWRTRVVRKSIPQEARGRRPHRNTSKKN